jgi:hypothetical protein
LINKIATIIAVLVFCCAAITTTTTNVFAGDSSKQILINNNIKDTESFGKWNNTDYTNFYKVENMFDNTTSEVSSWSQYGQSGWIVNLQNPLNTTKNVCSVEIDVYKPKNTPFNFKIGSNETGFSEVSSLLDNSKEVINIEDCIQNVTTLAFASNSPGNWTTISEVKLFSNETTGGGPEPEPCPPGTHKDPVTGLCIPDEPEPDPDPEPIPPTNITKLTITNSTVYANVTDSKVIVNISGESQVIENNADNPYSSNATDGGKEVEDLTTPMTDDEKQEAEEELDEKEHEEESNNDKDDDDEDDEDKEDDKN